MARSFRISTILALVAFGATLTGDVPPASALHCPASPDSFSWGTCITDEDEPGGQTVEETSAEISPALDCAEISVDFEQSGQMNWCRRYTLRVTNNCSSALAFDLPVLAGTNRLLPAGESAEIVGLEACVESARTALGTAADTGLDAGTSSADADGISGSDAMDTGAEPADTAADTAGSTSDTTTEDADAGDTGPEAPLREICTAFDAPSAAGEHTASYGFEHDGSRYELSQTVETISFETWYGEQCADEPGIGDTGTEADAAGEGPPQSDEGGTCGCSSARSGRALVGDVLLLGLLLGILRLRRVVRRK